MNGDMIGRILCLIGLHRFRGSSIPHVYDCTREGCSATESGYP